MRTPLPYASILICLSLLVGAVGCSGDDGPERIDTPTFQHDPQQFTFPNLAAGISERRDVDLINVGTGELIITDIALDDGSTAGEFELFMVDGDDLVDVPGRVTLPPNDAQRIRLVVMYAPSDEGESDAAVVRMATNDPAALDVAIPVVTGGQGAEIVVAPRSIDFGEVPAGDTVPQLLTITNIGLAELRISRFSVNGSADFSVQRAGETLTDLAANPLVVAPGANIEVDVVYAPARLGPDEGELLITSNDALRPTVAVNLRANGAAPCIQVIPDSVDFGSALQVEGLDGPTPNKKLVSIESCGTTPLRIDRIEIESADGVFKLIEDPDVEPPVAGDPLFTLPAATPGEDYPNSALNVGFWPTELRAYGGRMLIHSNATIEPFVVDLFGRGVQNACPIPVVVTAEYNAVPLDVIVLDGSPSMDPGGMVTRWQWTVVSRPDGSVSQPVERFTDPRAPADGGDPDDESTATVAFFVDLAGHYEIELQVYDNLGQVSCDPVPVARVVVDAVPTKDLHIQLVWSTPDDIDETDNIGTDVDLHLRHQSGGDAWASDAGEWDCFFANKAPDWGIAGDVSDNPTLDIDDTNGAGPENINLESPEVGVSYDIAALYFRSESTFGSPDVNPRTEHPSYVSVRVFVRGELLAEFIDRELLALRQLWWVASIEWCEDFSRCPEVTVRDQVLEEFEYDRP